MFSAAQQNREDIARPTVRLAGRGVAMAFVKKRIRISGKRCEFGLATLHVCRLARFFTRSQICLCKVLRRTSRAACKDEGFAFRFLRAAGFIIDVFFRRRVIILNRLCHVHNLVSRHVDHAVGLNRLRCAARFQPDAVIAARCYNGSDGIGLPSADIRLERPRRWKRPSYRHRSSVAHHRPCR